MMMEDEGARKRKRKRKRDMVEELSKGRYGYGGRVCI